jgi:mannose-1-phosphate guanylyltransferase
MKALILAAGFGTRLGEITQNLPKALVQVGNKPMIDFCIERLEEIGVSEILINVHYKANLMHDYFLMNKYSSKIELSDEPNLLGTAGTIKKHIKNLATEDFIVMHADNYFSGTLKPLLDGHLSRESGEFGTMGTFTTNDPSSCGILELNPDGTIKAFFEKVQNPPGNLANAAIYLFTPQIVGPLNELTGEVLDIGKDLIPKISSKLSTAYLGEKFVDIGTPHGLARAEVLYALNKK